MFASGECQPRTSVNVMKKSLKSKLGFSGCSVVVFYLVKDKTINTINCLCCDVVKD